MSSIKNLKSGRTPDTADSNPTLPIAGDKYSLHFGQTNSSLLIQEQSNRTLVVANSSHNAKGGTVKP